MTVTAAYAGNCIAILAVQKNVDGSNSIDQGYQAGWVLNLKTFWVCHPTYMGSYLLFTGQP